MAHSIPEGALPPEFVSARFSVTLPPGVAVPEASDSEACCAGASETMVPIISVKEQSPEMGFMSQHDKVDNFSLNLNIRPPNGPKHKESAHSPLKPKCDLLAWPKREITYMKLVVIRNRLQRVASGA